VNRGILDSVPLFPIQSHSRKYEKGDERSVIHLIFSKNPKKLNKKTKRTITTIINLPINQVKNAVENRRDEEEK